MGSYGLRLLNTRAANQPGIESVSDPIRGITTNPTPTLHIALLSLASQAIMA
jgi:hypothetical protein